MSTRPQRRSVLVAYKSQVQTTFNFLTRNRMNYILKTFVHLVYEWIPLTPQSQVKTSRYRLVGWPQFQLGTKVKTSLLSNDYMGLCVRVKRPECEADGPQPTAEIIRNVCTRGSVVVKALCYKPEGRGFDTRCEFLNLPNLSGRTRPWGLLSLQQKWVSETLK
jgi:hypothetical protein